MKCAFETKSACRSKRDRANHNRVQSETSVRPFFTDALQSDPPAAEAHGYWSPSECRRVPLVFCIQSSAAAAPHGSSHFHTHTTGHVLSGGQRSLDFFCQLVWRRYWNGAQPRPTTPLPPRGESMEVQVPACLWNWPRPQRQVPVLWLASQHGSSPHLKHSQEEKFNTYI